MPRQVNNATLELVRSFEGLYLEAYRDEAGVWTIGYGHTGFDIAGGAVKPGRKLADENEALAILRVDLDNVAKDVEKLLLIRPKAELNDNQFGALVSFAFNVGIGNLEKSALLRRLNGRDYLGTIPEFAKWNRCNGKVLRGLTRRRNAEAALFCSFPPPVISAS
ncbi:lysozyme [Prosthecobacter sp.]|uniref:lysozyme n=1 Tax=Prosthecobacter sp. TaxID=1965333 RepID=UPI00378394F2